MPNECHLYTWRQIQLTDVTNVTIGTGTMISHNGSETNCSMYHVYTLSSLPWQCPDDTSKCCREL